MAVFYTMDESIHERIRQAERVLASGDPELGRLIKRNGHLVREPRPDYFYSLARSIVGQQVSVAAAAAIFGRLGEATGMAPARILALGEEELRAVGLSRQKIRYIQDLAAKFAENPMIYENLEQLPDEEVIRELTAVRGVGIWTAQMFLMFTLVRLDVFAPDDIGLQRAMRVLYGWEQIPQRAEIEATAECWRPYRTVAAWHLWHSLDNEPVGEEMWK
jgi:DNA-3-methyladenine glycosylase II